MPDAHWIDLLRTDRFLALTRDPARFRAEVLALEPGSWVVVDEVQRLPVLLNEVHALIAEFGDRYRYALSGSSARRLRRLDVNLLAGRLIERRFFPLTGFELGDDLDADRLLPFGTLPVAINDQAHVVNILEAYARTYLEEEIQREALVKDLGSFSRFLSVASLVNAQVVNVTGLARDVGIARTTVQRFFDLLVDTLVGVWLPRWQERIRAKEVAKPKFYFFDPGVVRALAGLLRDPVADAERGPLLETAVLGELRAHISYADIGGQLSYWRTRSGKEVDFLWTRAGRTVGFEVKASARWRSNAGVALKELLASGAIDSAFGIYLGDQILQDGPVRVLPYARFVRDLPTGRVL